MNETIDPTEWLHQSVHKAYPDLLKKLGAIEQNGKILCSTRFPFDQLYRFPENDPIFNGSHLSAAEFITTLHEAAFRKMGHCRLKDMIRELTHGTADLSLVFCPMTLYVRIMRGMNPMQTHLVKRLCFQELRSNDIGWVVQCSGSIRLAFDFLGKMIEKELDTLDKIKENNRITNPQLCQKFPEPVSGN